LVSVAGSLDGGCGCVVIGDAGFEVLVACDVGSLRTADGVEAEVFDSLYLGPDLVNSFL
jgi:hypothetical protein